MSGKINAGVVMVTKFITNESETFASYIDYMDRDNATRLKHVDEFTTDKLYEESKNKNADYLEYMGDPQKLSNLFTADKNVLTDQEKKELKRTFAEAQENGSLMWQTVFSFDNRWLEKNGLYDSESKELNEEAMMGYIRKSMQKMLSLEKLDLAVWSGAIHYNTDNIHIHLATVEPVPTRTRLEKGAYVGQYKGTWKQKTIRSGKSALANEIIRDKGFNEKINNIVRGTILKTKKERPLYNDKEFGVKFARLHDLLPEDKRLWKYGNNAMKPYLPLINELTDLYIEKYHKDDFNEMKATLMKQDELYVETYGQQRYGKSFYESKMDDFYKRFGNSILSELRTYSYELKSADQFKAYQQMYSKQARKFSPAPLRNSLIALTHTLDSNIEDVRSLWAYQHEYEYQQWLEQQRMQHMK